MDPTEYERVIGEFTKLIPPEIQEDHRVSFRNRLKYGNEHSFRKRVADLLNRLPENVRHKIANEEVKFVSKTADTRNYYTHYDHASEGNVFQDRDAVIASERLRILIVANMLHDLGIEDEQLLNILQRNAGFRHWMNTALHL
jgi:hypothetical protein